MYNYDDPWGYIVQRLNDRAIQLWEGVSLIIRLVDSQREVSVKNPSKSANFCVGPLLVSF